MNKFTSTLLAAVLGFSPAVVTTAHAASPSVSLNAVNSIGATLPSPIASAVLGGYQGDAASGAVQENLIEAQYRNRYYQDRRGYHQRGHKPRIDNRHRGYHPHRSQRQTSRSPDLGSAVVGAIIGGIIVNEFNQPRRAQTRATSTRYLSQSHVNWCHNRWRSYRVSDNSYQPYNGPRRVCASPYGP